MDNLIEKLERADGADRELDWDIAVATGLKKPEDKPGMWGGINQMAFVQGVHRYTASIDAALTLAEPGDAAQIMDEAIRLLGLHGWKGRWRDALPRFIVIAALKARGAGG